MNPNNHWPQYLAEFIGTFFLVFFGCGAVIMAELSSQNTAPFIPIIFGGTVTIMIYAVGHISGAHFNPAVTAAFWLIGRFPLVRMPWYLLAQTCGALLASMVHLYLWGRGHSFGMTELSIAAGPGFLMEMILSFSLMFVITSVATDSRAVGEMAGIAIGTTVAICAFVGGPLTGASMNPARSLGPAIVSGDLTHLWIYIVAPLLSACLGAKVYEWIRCSKSVQGEKHGCC